MGRRILLSYISMTLPGRMYRGTTPTSFIVRKEIVLLDHHLAPSSNPRLRKFNTTLEFHPFCIGIGDVASLPTRMSHQKSEKDSISEYRSKLIAKSKSVNPPLILFNGIHAEPNIVLYAPVVSSIPHSKFCIGAISMVLYRLPYRPEIQRHAERTRSRTRHRLAL
ncbi:hypothetical protein P280DRAFT_278178 [Massarina eburnea CBS 473.64]|uniref:Uncharacterized protein n=1 Tax=Massarina eburnea CBS 473.64 TaxID=1395130 RepID=A0A6A6RGA1_9PLEO|nr:hypothetical protein P280DRAFT_278178 [Massarina eburnea CBS 473.64]